MYIEKVLSMTTELQAVGHLICGKEWAVDEHPHFHRIYYVYGGEARCEMEGKMVDLEQGHLYMFPINRAIELTIILISH